MTLGQIDALAFERLHAGAGLARWQLEAATLLAQWLVYLVPLSLIALWLTGARAARLAAVRALACAAIALLVNQAIGLAWYRPRPFAIGLGHAFMAHVADSSFPSDHVTVLAATGITLWLSSAMPVRRVGIALTAAAIGAGWARVFLGIHYPGDVAGGFAVAALTRWALARPALQVCCTWLTLRLESAYRRLLAWPIARGWLRA